MNKEIINITPKFIKEHIEDITGVKDLSIKSRKREIVEIRSVCFTLTRTLCLGVSLASIGELYNKDHATVIHGLKMFETLKDQYHFKNSNTLYKTCLAHFLQLSDKGIYKRLRKLQTLEEIKDAYNEKLLVLTNKYRKVINNQARNLGILKDNLIFAEVCKLPEAQFTDLENRINAFLKMNNNEN